MSVTLSQYNVTTTTAATDFNLVPTIASGYVLTVLTVQIAAPTAATVNLLIYNSSGTLAQTVPLEITAADAVVLDHKLIIPAGGKLAVNSTATDTTFTAHGALGTV